MAKRQVFGHWLTLCTLNMHDLLTYLLFEVRAPDRLIKVVLLTTTPEKLANKITPQIRDEKNRNIERYNR